MPGRIRSCARAAASLTIAALAFAPSALAIQPPREKPAKDAQLLDLGFQSPALEVAPSLSSFSGETLADVAQAETAAAHQESVKGLQRLMSLSSSDWEVRWDDRSDRPHLVQGAGLALLPGAGNRLRADEAGLADAKGGERAPAMADVERLLRGFMTDYADLLRVDQASLRLDTSRSVTVGNGRSWFIEFQQVHNGVPVEGANVYFRINNGNLVQFGADRVGDIANLSTKPTLTNKVALNSVLRRLGIAQSAVREVVDPGTLKIYPTLVAGESPAETFKGARGQGYGHVLAWELTFRRTGSESTYKAVVDARTGALLQLRDLTVYATVTGGIYPTTNSDVEVVRPLPFANVTNGTAKVTDASGFYAYTGGTATSTLNGRYIRISDNCGAISLSNSTTGDLAFGTSGGTDCTTPGVGGAGNTHAARSGFYHLTNINRKAANFLTGNSWLNGTLQANMNINQTCNAFWNGSTVNFYRSGGGCSNTGEIAAVFLHEWGHGMDTNSGGAASENGTGEAVGDTFAFLETKDGCIGQNFIPGQNCANCTSCTGVRDVAEFSLNGSGSHTIARPSTVADNNGINCDRFACPYLSQGIFPYQGPMGYEGHCESYIASTANWDLAQSLVATYGTTAGWAAMDQIWYESLTPSKSAYRLVSGGKCNPNAVVDGCGANNWYTVYLAADDDDGNLANGTPNGCRIWDAFNAHGIACGARPACSGGCTPTATANAGPDQTIPAGGSATIGTAAQAGHTYSWSPGGQTSAVITVSPASTTTYTVTATTTCGSASDSVTVNVTVADTTPPTTSITAPANGATVSGTVNVTASASDNVGVARVEFLVDGALASTDTTSPYSFSWNTSALTPGSSHTLASRAFDAANNQGTSANVSVTIGSALTAVYDSVLRAPKCAAVGVSCDSGASLLNGRDGKGPEPNQPNTINNSCADGTSGTFHSDESNDRLKVSTVDGTSLQAGKQVRIDATVWAWTTASADKLDLYYAANANSPSWVFIGTLTPPGSGARTLSATYTLPAGALQAVRAQFRYQGSASACTSGGYNDRDDLIFAVSP